MSVYQIVYLAFLSTSFGISLYVYPSFGSNKSFRLFPILLGLSLLTETVVNILHYGFGTNYTFIYHLYLPAEYLILAYFFYLNTLNSTVRQAIFLSAPVYVVISLLISIKIIALDNYPGLNFNLEGILLVTWSLITLFTIPPTEAVPITRLPLFWICVGVLVFHVGIFSFNGIYNYLRVKNPGLTIQLHRLTIKGLNYTLYSCFSLAFICSHQMKKLLSPS